MTQNPAFCMGTVGDSCYYREIIFTLEPLSGPYIIVVLERDYSLYQYTFYYNRSMIGIERVISLGTVFPGTVFPGCSWHLTWLVILNRIYI